MPTDPLDKQLVEAVLTRPRRAKADLEEAKLAGLRPSRSAAAVADEDDADDDDDRNPRRARGRGRGRHRRSRRRRRGCRRARLAAARRADQARPEGGRGADGRGARGPLGRHDRHRRPGPDVPQGDRQGRAADRRGGGRPRQGHRAGEQMVEEPWKAMVSLHEWTLHDTEHKTRTMKPQHRLPFGDEAHEMVRAAISAKGRRTCWSRRPTST